MKITSEQVFNEIVEYSKSGDTDRSPSYDKAIVWASEEIARLREQKPVDVRAVDIEDLADIYKQAASYEMQKLLSESDGMSFKEDVSIAIEEGLKAVLRAVGVSVQ